jgi:hypothetical protein
MNKTCLYWSLVWSEAYFLMICGPKFSQPETTWLLWGSVTPDSCCCFKRFELRRPWRRMTYIVRVV